jgi:hypothetical protein
LTTDRHSIVARRLLVLESFIPLGMSRMLAAFVRFGCAAIAVVTLVVSVPPAGAQPDERFPPSSVPRVHQPVAYQPPTFQLPPNAPSLRLTVTPLPGQGTGAPGTRSSAQLVCVRTCDGFFFPVSAGGSADRAVAEFMCKASCPGAPVKLFTRRAGGEIEDAVGADRSGYRKLAAALSFRKEVSPACSCRRPSGAITTGPVYDDPTLRAGDVIVVGGRALVFKGGTRPYGARDFAPWSSRRYRPRRGRTSSRCSISAHPFRRAARAGLPRRSLRQSLPSIRVESCASCCRSRSSAMRCPRPHPPSRQNTRA